MVASYYLKKCLHSPRKWRGLFVENFCKYDLKKKKRLINLEKHAMIVWSRNETNDLHRWRCTGHPMNISVMLLLYTRYIITTALICRLKIYPNLSSVKNQPKSWYRYVARRHNWQCKHLTLLLNSTVIHWKLFLSTSNFCLGIWGVPLYAQRYRKWKPISATNSSGLAAGQLSRLVLECWSWNFEPCFLLWVSITVELVRNRTN